LLLAKENVDLHSNNFKEGKGIKPHLPSRALQIGAELLSHLLFSVPRIGLEQRSLN
jgi:hypothetical protein